MLYNTSCKNSCVILIVDTTLYISNTFYILDIYLQDFKLIVQLIVVVDSSFRCELFKQKGVRNGCLILYYLELLFAISLYIKLE